MEADAFIIITWKSPKYFKDHLMVLWFESNLQSHIVPSNDPLKYFGDFYAAILNALALRFLKLSYFDPFIMRTVLEKPLMH